MASNPLRLTPSPIEFGTDGWRGVLGVDITIERLLKVAAAAAQELEYRGSKENPSREIVIGYDRRFLAPEMAEAIAAAIKGCDLDPVLSETPVPTPACSWAVVRRRSLGALVITASHNPPEWIGLKIKGPFGGSVERDFTKSVEKRLLVEGISVPVKSNVKKFDCREEHLNELRRKFDFPSLINGLKEMNLKIIVDSMHGSASGCIKELFGEKEDEKDSLVEEINQNRDPLFGGNAPEPLVQNISKLIDLVKASTIAGKPAIGIVFDGDGDRIAAVDENGRFCSTQLLIPLLIDHLARVRNLPGCVVKTVSGSDLMRLVAEDLGRNVIELPVGFKYIASTMLDRDVLVGGEESGGVGFGIHLPERDALFTAILVLEAIKESQQTLANYLTQIESRFGASHYDRIDLILGSKEVRKKLETLLESKPPRNIFDQKVKQVIYTDGIKLILDKSYWLMFRFSGTEPLLRIYCEAPTKELLIKTLDWAKNLAEG